MYQPAVFKEERLEPLHTLIRTHPLAALVVLGDDGLSANHIPMILDPGGTEKGILRGHIAKANPLWKEADSRIDALAIFQGPQAYVTPTWYPSKQAHGKAVPTWNYVVVHAYGPLRFVEDDNWLFEHLRSLSDEHEENRPSPWGVDDAPTGYLEKMRKAVIGFELPIRRLEGKWKVSQNKSPEDRAGVAQGLAADGLSEMARRVGVSGTD